MSKPSVSKKVVIILPKWQNPQDGNKAIQTEWKRYVKALTVHQLGHVKNASNAQKAILVMFKQFPAQPSCLQLKKKANAAAREVLNDYYAKDKDYEKASQKGLTQGAVFKEPN